MAKDLSKEEEAKTIADLLKESDEAYNNKLTQLKEEKPVLDNSEYNIGTHVGTALQGLGNYISKRGGATPSSTVGSLYSDVNKKRADEFAKLLKEWESQKEALRDEHKNNMTKIGLIAKHTKTPEEIAKDAAVVANINDQIENRKETTDIARQNAAATAAYRQEKLGVERQKLEGKTPTSKMEEERGKLDVKNVVENEQAIPEMEALVNNGEEIVRILDSGDHSIGGKMEKAGTIIGGPVGRWVETERSPNDQKIMGYQNQMLLNVLSTQLGPQTEGDRAVAMQIQGSSTTDPTVIKDNIKKLQALTRTKIENTRAASKYLQEHGSLAGFVPKSTFGEKANSGAGAQNGPAIGTVNGVRYYFDPVTKKNLGRVE